MRQTLLALHELVPTSRASLFCCKIGSITFQKKIGSITLQLLQIYPPNYTPVDGERQVMPKGGLDLRCSLVFALVLFVLETALFCSLRVLYFR